MSAEQVQRQRERELGHKMQPPLAKRFNVDVVGASFMPAYPGNLYELETLQFMAEDRGEPIPVVLIREPDNPHDSNAVAIHVPSLGDVMGKVGMITRPVAAKIAPHLDAGEHWLGEIVQLKLDPEHPERPGLRINLRKVDDA